jgi:hypothetical protein
VVHRPSELPGFVALREGRRTGLVTYRIDGAECEIVTLDSLEGRLGIGTALLEAAVAAARDAGCRRAWLVTTNDNLDALRFYQKRGFALTALYPGALVQSRSLKPQIPLVGQHGIPLRDEIELEMQLGRDSERAEGG